MNKDVDEILINALAGLDRYRKQAEERRLKKLWQEVSLPQSFAETLARLTKDDLTNICRHHELRNLSSLKKGELIVELARILPQKVESELLTLDEDRYEFLRQFISEEDGKFVLLETDDVDTTEAEYWRNTGFVFSGTVNNEKVLYMPQEILKKFQALDHQSLLKTVRRNQEWISLTQGMLFYYGVLSFNQLRTRLEAFTGTTPDYLEFYRILIGAKEYYNLIKIT